MNWLFLFIGYFLGKSDNGAESSGVPKYNPPKEHTEFESRTLIYSKETGELLRTRVSDKICRNHREHEYNEFGALYSGECSYKDYSPDGKLLTDSYKISPLNRLVWQREDSIYSTKNRKLLRTRILETSDENMQGIWKEYSPKGKLLQTEVWNNGSWAIKKEPKSFISRFVRN